MDFLTLIDADFLLVINGWRSLWADYFMYAFSGKIIWIPLYAAILYVLFRNMSWRVALLGVLTITLIILFADQTCSSLIRPWIGRMRPANLENPLSDYIEIVNGYRGGKYGFPSCHAANTFGLAFYVYYMLRQRWFTLFMMLWALVTCYSRAYLGVHYPGDLVAGALVGYVGAFICCRLFAFLSVKYLCYVRPAYTVNTWVPLVVGSLTILCIFIYSFLSAA